MIASVFTANLLFIGLVNGLSVALVAMGIVLVYRSSRVINFAVGDLGVPAAALLAVMAGKSHVPYWPALIGALLVGTFSGAVVGSTRRSSLPVPGASILITVAPMTASVRPA